MVYAMAHYVHLVFPLARSCCGLYILRWHACDPLRLLAMVIFVTVAETCARGHMCKIPLAAA